MAKRIEPPHSGYWPFQGYPDRIRLLGRVFRKAGWRQPYADVDEQYREEVETDSMHLKVHSDGTWTIDHTDRANPDLGKATEHFFSDTPLGRGIVVFGSLAAMVGVATGGALLVAKAIGAVSSA